jgi:hypothetical protein
MRGSTAATGEQSGVSITGRSSAPILSSLIL